MALSGMRHHPEEALIMGMARYGYDHFFIVGLAPILCCGRGTCRDTISSADCFQCLRVAQLHWLHGILIQYYNGAAKLVDCTMRWAWDLVDPNYCRPSPSIGYHCRVLDAFG